jgi:hypothetical protein
LPARAAVVLEIGRLTLSNLTFEHADIWREPRARSLSSLRG